MLDKTSPAIMGLGLAALGRPGYINLGHDDDLGEDKSVEALRNQAWEVLDAAWAAGVRYFDAARSYGRAEEFLGGWLRERDIPAAEVFIASKWGYTYTAGWQTQAEHHEIKEHSPAVLQRQMGETRQNLGDYLRLYQIHSATQASGVLENIAVPDALAELKAQGLQIGFSSSGPTQAATIAQALEIERDGRLLFDAVQATWNPLEISAGKALQAAHDAGLHVIVKEALANGRLTARNQNPTFAAQRQVLESIAGELGAGIDAVALAAALAQPWASVVLSGAATVEQLQSNLAARELALQPEHWQALAGLAEEPEAYWQTRSQLAWN